METTSYYDIKASSQVNGDFKYDLIATKLEDKFNRIITNRDGPLSFINDIFYKKWKMELT